MTHRRVSVVSSWAVWKLRAALRVSVAAVFACGGTLYGQLAESQGAASPPAGSTQTTQQPGQNPPLSAEDRAILDFLKQTTINVNLDFYYQYNFNHPVGRVTVLRAYDVVSNLFSLNQAGVILDHPPDVAASRRWGGRLDLQFGQATDTLQGNPLNEPRPQIYRNVYQAFGTYVFPVAESLNVDFGKWGSSLGIEGNYTKDQINYSRSYWFNFLPFYHMGFRGSLALNNGLSLNLWVVNGTNQVEATNGFKDQMYGFTAKPSENITWTVNYYRGQENPDRILGPPQNSIPVQPGLTFQSIVPPPDGRTHIIDTYATLQLHPKLLLALEGDYFIQRLWRHSGPGRSSAPSRVDGGAAYLRYQITPKMYVATRAEYLSDRGGVFGGISSQALKENTVTFNYKVGEGLLIRPEWRRDYSNQPAFLTSVDGVLSKHQTTLTVGMVIWWGRKTGSW